MECKVKKSDVIQKILLASAQGSTGVFSARLKQGMAYAPTNIALCKYWGKRDTELNLPITSSLSITLPDKGAMTTLAFNEGAVDTVVLNGKELAGDSGFVKRIVQYLDLYRAG